MRLVPDLRTSDLTIKEIVAMHDEDVQGNLLVRPLYVPDVVRMTSAAFSRMMRNHPVEVYRIDSDGCVVVGMDRG